MLTKLIAAWNHALNVEPSNLIPPTIVTRYQVPELFVKSFTEVLKAYVSKSLGAGGNLMAEAHYENGDVFTLWTIERWSDAGLYNANTRKDEAHAIHALAKKRPGATVERLFIKELELVNNNSFFNASLAEAVNIMLLVDVQAGKEGHFKSINHELASAIKHKPGLLFFQFGQVGNAKTKFMIWKKFESWNVFQQHLKEPSIEPIMKFLKHSVKDPPFEKGYHHLIRFAP